ncbi:MAG TPA: hypothetical protein VGD01_19630 [Candidatus Elarobacter sp.]
MTPALRAIAVAAGLCALSATAATGTQIATTTPPPLVVDLPAPGGMALAGAAQATARARGERAELLVLAEPQTTAALNAAATDVVATVLRKALPGFEITAEPTAYTENGLHALSGFRSGGEVRVAIPGPLDDARLRELVDRARAALNQPGWRSVGRGARIADVALGLRSCEEFSRAAERDVIGQVDELAAALGTRAPRRTALADRTPRPVGGWPDPLCGPQSRTRPWALRRPLAPTTAEARETRSYAFARRLDPVAPPATTPLDAAGEPFGGGSWSPVRLRVPAGAPAMTVYGFATARDEFDGAKYVWQGLHGAVSLADQHRDFIGEARRRLGAIGIPASDVIAQLDPATGSPFIEVATHALEPRDDVVAAIAGDRAIERDNVKFLRYRNRCGPRGDDLRRAVADASARAKRLAADLGLAVDTARPLAILSPAATVGTCSRRDTPPYDDRIVHSFGGIAPPAHTSYVAVSVTYALRGSPALVPRAPAAAHVLEDTQPSPIGPPPVDHASGAIAGEARVATTLSATGVLLRAHMSPDHAHAFRALEGSLPSRFLERIGARVSDAVVTRTPLTPEYGGDPFVRTDELEAIARVPMRPALQRDLASIALELNRSGNVGIDDLPMRPSCAREAPGLVVEAVRAAAAQAVANAGLAHATAKRLIAVDVTGPVVLNGSCRLGMDARRAADFRYAELGVKLAVYARVVYR